MENSLQSNSANAAKDFIAKLLEENRSFYESPRGRGALKDLQQTFPSPWLYVAEIIQNAVDAKARCIRFCEPVPGTLVLEHNGDAFDEKDVEGICTKGVSSKGAGTVGFMGVGFKSVFRSFEKVKISSGQWSFYLQTDVIKGSKYGDKQRNWLGAVLPHWLSDTAKPSSGFTCRFELTGRLEDLPPITDDFKHIFHENQTLLALLALRGIEEIDLFSTSWVLSAKIFEDSNIRYLIEALDSNSGRVRQWLLFRSCYTPSNDAVRRFLEHRQINPAHDEKERVYSEASRERFVEIFFPLDDDGCPDLPEHGQAYALLPTNQEVPFGVHINADWLLTVTRTDFMDLSDDTNAWQAEIRAQLPKLIKDYLEWLGSDNGPKSMDWEIAYRIFPDISTATTIMQITSNFANWLLHKEFIYDLSYEINSVRFLPDMGSENGEFGFLSPKDGRLLPPSLADLVDDDPSFLPWELFPETAINSYTLGERAKEFLFSNNIVQEFSLEELAIIWGKEGVPNWYGKIDPENRFDSLYLFLRALSKVETKSSVTHSNPALSPDFYNVLTDEGLWANASQIVRYPADWNILINEYRLPEMLGIFIGEGKSLLDMQFESHVARRNRNFWESSFVVKQPKLEEVVSRWWKALSCCELTKDNINDIVLFTCWVQEKQKNRRALVSYLLTDDLLGATKLLRFPEVLLEGPYAGTFRRQFFPDLPVVSDRYYQHSSKDADWKGFFEGTHPRPIGRFHLKPTTYKLCKSDAEKGLADGDTLADTRVTYYSEDWRRFPSVTVTNDDYVLINFTLHEDLLKQLSSSEDLEYYRAFGEWMSETSGHLKEFVYQRLLYIPYGCSNIEEKVMLKNHCSWVNQLSELKWVVAKDGSGPYRPRDILKRIDPARPEMPIVDLSPDLIKILENAGIHFESDVPQAEAIKKLQFEGPLASRESLKELLIECIDAVENHEASREELKQALMNNPLFPNPEGGKFVDGSLKVSGKRLVIRSGSGSAHRSDFGWLCPLDKYHNGTLDGEIVLLVRPYLDIPDKTSWSQCMDFLEWVWMTEPTDIELFRQTLPRAYSYVAEDLKLDPTGYERWNDIRHKAMVFTLGRSWRNLNSNPPVYFDDIGKNLQIEIVPKNQLATAGHLGVKQKDSALPDGVELLNLPLLSSQYAIHKECTESIALPPQWDDRFKQIESFLHELHLKRDEMPEEDTEDEPDEEKISSFKFNYLTKISWKIISVITGETKNIISSWAERDENEIRFSGSPSDFAAELSLLLVKAKGFKRRSDDSLTAELAVLIVLLDSAEFSGHLLSLRKRFGLSLEEEPKNADEVNPDSDEHDDDDDSVDDDSVDDDDDDSKGGVGKKKQPKGTSSGSSGSAGLRSGKEGSSSGSKKGSSGHRTGSHTPQDRERKIEGLVKRLNELKALGVKSETDDDGYDDTGNDPTSDEEYRDAVIAYEFLHGRFAEYKHSLQKGYDIDSFSGPTKESNKTLVRRIEVKGRNHVWEGDQTVELSHIQFKHALEKLEEDGIKLAEDFDYWVYVVEKTEDGKYRILPVRNPARSSRKFELRAGTWGHFVENEGVVDLANRGVKFVRKPQGRSIFDLRDKIKKSEEADDD